MSYTYWIVDTITGEKQEQVFPLEGGNADRLLNAAGSGGTHSFLVGTFTNMTLQQWEDLLNPWSRTIVVSWNGKVKYSGLIARQKQIRTGNRFEITHVDVRVLLAARFVFGGGQYRPGLQTGEKPGDLIVTHKELYSIAAQVIRVALTGPHGIYGLPFALAGQAEGGHNRDYHNEELVIAENALQEIQSADGGPDIDLASRWTDDDTHEWYQRTGSPAQPLIISEEVTVLMSTEKPDAEDLVKIRDGAGQYTGVFAVGTGKGKDRRIEGSGLVDDVVPTTPARDTTEEFDWISESSELYSHATAEARAKKDPVEQWEMSLRVDGDPGLDNIELGSLVNLYFAVGDYWRKGDGWVHLRCVGYKLDGSKNLKITVQPMGA